MPKKRLLAVLPAGRHRLHDRLLVREAFEESRLLNELRFVEDGEELLEYLRRQGRYSSPDASPRPGLILLDLNMPRMDGREALRAIKDDDDLRRIPVVVMTTSKAEEDVLQAYGLHANCYVTKPVEFTSFAAVIRTIEKFWFTVVTLPDEPA